MLVFSVLNGATNTSSFILPVTHCRCENNENLLSRYCVLGTAVFHTYFYFRFLFVIPVHLYSNHRTSLLLVYMLLHTALHCIGRVGGWNVFKFHHAVPPHPRTSHITHTHTHTHSSPSHSHLSLLTPHLQPPTAPTSKHSTPLATSCHLPATLPRCCHPVTATCHFSLPHCHYHLPLPAATCHLLATCHLPLEA